MEERGTVAYSRWPVATCRDRLPLALPSVLLSALLLLSAACDPGRDRPDPSGRGHEQAGDLDATPDERDGGGAEDVDGDGGEQADAGEPARDLGPADAEVDTGGPAPEDGGLPPDAGTPGDAGPPPDAGDPEDAGPLPDAGDPEDAGPLPDAGDPEDAGAPPDAGGPEDAGPPPDEGGPDDAGPPPDAGGAEDAGPPPDAGTLVPIRIMAANLTSGANQSYDLGHGIRIFQGLRPDIVLIQEFNYQNDQPGQLRQFVNEAFGPEFQYYREPAGSIPNGVISRYPIVSSGSWDDEQAPDRGFAWARIDVPGELDLWAVSVHLLTRSSTARDEEAAQLVDLVRQHVPERDYLVVGGDFNTGTRNELCLTTFSSILITGEPHPVDQQENGNTNAGRSKPYDWVLPDPDLAPRQIPLTIGERSFSHGLVFDSRVYHPLSDVEPVRQNDSGAQNMQHMAVVRDFAIPLN